MKRYKYGTDVDEEHIKERYMAGPRHNCVYACQMTRGQCVQRKKDAKTTGGGSTGYSNYAYCGADYRVLVCVLRHAYPIAVIQCMLLITGVVITL